jgi:hypothetical protein
VVELSGTWRGDGGRYRVRLLPVARGVALGRGVQALAVPLSSGGRASEVLPMACHWQPCVPLHVT